MLQAQLILTEPPPLMLSAMCQGCRLIITLIIVYGEWRTSMSDCWRRRRIWCPWSWRHAPDQDSGVASAKTCASCWPSTGYWRCQPCTSPASWSRTQTTRTSGTWKRCISALSQTLHVQNNKHCTVPPLRQWELLKLENIDNVNFISLQVVANTSNTI